MTTDAHGWAATLARRMLAAPVDAVPEGPGLVHEPKWDGRAVNLTLPTRAA